MEYLTYRLLNNTFFKKFECLKWIKLIVIKARKLKLEKQIKDQTVSYKKVKYQRKSYVKFERVLKTLWETKHFVGLVQNYCKSFTFKTIVTPSHL